MIDINTNIHNIFRSFCTNNKKSFKEYINILEDYLENASSIRLRCFRYKMFQLNTDIHNNTNNEIYLDFLVKSIILDDETQDINTAKNIKENSLLMNNFITKYLFTNPENNRLLKNHIKSIHRQMILTYTNEIELYSLDSIQLITSYYLIFKNGNRNNTLLWELIDYSFGYIYMLKTYIKKQIIYYDKLQIYDYEYKNIYIHTNSLLYRKLIELDIFITNTNTNIVIKPKTPEEYRIFYNYCILTKTNIIYNHSSILYSNHKNYGLAESILIYYSNQTHLNKKELKIFFNNSLILFKNPDFNHNYIQSFNVLKIINNIIKNIHKLDLQNWNHHYHNNICIILDYLIRSYSGIIKYINKSHNGLIKIDNLYITTIYTLISIEMEMIENIISHIPIVINIYFKKMNKFEIFDIINILSRILTDYNFKTILIFLKNMNRYSNTIDYSHFIYNTWTQIISCLEKEKEDDLEYLINKLCDNGFKYHNLDYRIIKKIKKNRQILIKFEQYASQDYQNLITHLADLFGDPITGDIITEPMILPITKQIVDKNVIYRILHENETNPFNNLPLTIKELNEYNQQSEIKEQLNQFINDFNTEKEQKIKVNEKS